MTREMRYWGRAFGVSALIVAAACGGDGTGPQAEDPAQVFRSLRLNHNAVTIALTPPYDTVRLVVTAYGLGQTPIAQPGLAIYTATDSAVTVSPDGLVQAQYATDSTMIIVKMQVANVTLADTAILRVTPTAVLPRIASFSVHTPGDSARGSSPENAAGQVSIDSLFVLARDSVGNILSDSADHRVLAYFTSSNPGVAKIGHANGVVYPFLPGRVTYYASAYVYGVAYRDTLAYVVNYPLSTNIVIASSVSKTTGKPVQYFARPVVHIAVGGVVTWSGTRIPMDVTFDDPAHVEPGCPFNLCAFYPAEDGGDIPPFNYTGEYGFAFRARRFLVAGTYDYHSELYHTNGTVIVSSIP